MKEAKTTQPKNRTNEKPRRVPEKYKGLSLRHDLAFKYYSDPKSETFDNAYKSCIKGGLTESVAKNVTNDKWWIRKIEALQDQLITAEEVIKNSLTMNTKTMIVVGKSVMEVESPALKKLQLDSAWQVAKSVGKDRYSEKIQVEDITPPKVEENSVLRKLFKL